MLVYALNYGALHLPVLDFGLRNKKIDPDKGMEESLYFVCQGVFTG